MNLRVWMRVAYFEICTVQIIFLSQAVCERAHIAKCADKMGHQLARPSASSIKILLIFIVCGDVFAHSEVRVRPASLRYGFVRSRVYAAGSGWIKILIYR